MGFCQHPSDENDRISEQKCNNYIILSLVLDEMCDTLALQLIKWQCTKSSKDQLSSLNEQWKSRKFCCSSRAKNVISSYTEMTKVLYLVRQSKVNQQGQFLINFRNK